LTTREASISLVMFCAIYAFIFAFGTFYIYRLIRTGPTGKLFETSCLAIPGRPMSLANAAPIHKLNRVGAGE
jgi:cytochrome d ubiquinol oxidase subunit I